MSGGDVGHPVLLVLASTYPRWRGDSEPGFVHELSRRLVGKYRVIVLCPHALNARFEEVMDGVEVHRYRYAPAQFETLVNHGGVVTNLRRAPWKWALVPGFFLAQIWQAWRLCRRFKVSLIHAHWLIPQGFCAAVLQCLPGKSVPFVVTSHGADLFALRGRVLSAVKSWIARRAAVVTVVSSGMRDALSVMDDRAPLARVLPMGVDMLERFVPGDDHLRQGDELLFVGRLVEKKGLTHLLRALPLVMHERPAVRLTIVGFGPEEARLRAEAEALGLERAVRFLGAVSQSALPSLYQRASLCVAPFVEAESGDQEGLGLVTVEALACECPVLVGDVPAVHDVLGPEASAFITQPRDPVILASSILLILDNYSEALARTRRLRLLMMERFEWGRVADGYSELFEAVSLRD